MISASMLESGETAWAVSPFLIGIGDRGTGLQVVRETGGQGCRWWGRQGDRGAGGGGDRRTGVQVVGETGGQGGRCCGSQEGRRGGGACARKTVRQVAACGGGGWDRWS